MLSIIEPSANFLCRPRFIGMKALKNRYRFLVGSKEDAGISIDPGGRRALSVGYRSAVYHKETELRVPNGEFYAFGLTAKEAAHLWVVRSNQRGESVYLDSDLLDGNFYVFHALGLSMSESCELYQAYCGKPKN